MNNLPQKIGKDLVEIKNKIKYCKICFNFTEAEFCKICLDERRNRLEVLVVESALDIPVFEKANYRGRYHLLGGLISPLHGRGPEKLHLQELVTRIELEEVSEVILACATSLEGEATANYLINLIRERFGDKILITKLAKGLPLNSTIEYQDPATLGNAMDNRIKAN